jgi:hypothetical protein
MNPPDPDTDFEGHVAALWPERARREGHRPALPVVAAERTPAAIDARALKVLRRWRKLTPARLRAELSVADDTARAVLARLEAAGHARRTRVWSANRRYGDAWECA